MYTREGDCVLTCGGFVSENKKEKQIKLLNMKHERIQRALVNIVTKSSVDLQADMKAEVSICLLTRSKIDN